MALKPVGKFQIRGIGPVVTERLNEKGIYTLPDADRYVGENGLCGLMEVMKVGPMRSKKVLRHLRHGGGQCPRCMVRVNARQLEKAYDATVDGRECPLLRDYTKGGLPIMKPDEAPVPMEGAPIPIVGYQGGKFRQRRFLVGQMPPHKTYVEPFFGAGSILLAKPPVEKEVVNDRDPAMMKIHKAVKAEAVTFDFKPSRAKWEEIKAKDPSKRTAEEQAYLIEHAYGNKVNDAKTNYFSHGKKAGAYDTTAIHRRYEDAIMLNKDFATVMKMFDAPSALHYLDPPYHEEDSKNFNFGNGEDNVTPERVADVAGKMKGKVMVSYDNSPGVRKAFSGKKWRIKKYQVTRTIGASHGRPQIKRDELLISNFDISKARASAPEYTQVERTNIAAGMKGLFG